MVALDDFNSNIELHCQRTEQLAVILGTTLQINDISILQKAAAVHDVGKYYVPTHILDKPRPLTSLERDVVDMHAYYGYRYLLENGFDPIICQIVLYHHGDDKPKCNVMSITPRVKLLADIVRAADAYDALSSDRSYRKAFTHAQTLDILKNPDFNQMVVSVLTEILKTTKRKA